MWSKRQAPKSWHPTLLSSHTIVCPVTPASATASNSVTNKLCARQALLMTHLYPLINSKSSCRHGSRGARGSHIPNELTLAPNALPSHL